MKLLNVPLLSMLLMLPSGKIIAQADDCLQKFSWLTGDWKTGQSGTTIAEAWKSGTTSMEGSSYEVRGTDTVILEYMTIRCVGGQIFFTYHPVLKGEDDRRKPVDFILVSDKDDTYVFENKSHDFPQRVIYQQQQNGECHAWIEGTENGKYSKVDFFYSRIR